MELEGSGLQEHLDESAELELTETEELLATAVATHRVWLEGLDAALASVITIVSENAHSPSLMAEKLKELLPSEEG